MPAGGPTTRPRRSPRRKALDPASFDEAALKIPAIGEAASVVAAHSEVRAALLAFQRDFAAKPPGAVLDGRDIGTVICPDADAKIFVTADAGGARPPAGCGIPRPPAKHIDEAGCWPISAAATSATPTAPWRPLKQAPDAHLLDTTHLDIEAAIRAAIDIVEAARAGRGRG